MEQRIRDIETKIVVVVSDIDNLKSKMSRVENVEKEISDIKATVSRMEMIDNNIFEKLTAIVDSVVFHKKNFEKHDAKEMRKYELIDIRLKKLERVMYMGIGAGILLQLLHTFKLFGALQ